MAKPMQLRAQNLL